MVDRFKEFTGTNSVAGAGDDGVVVVDPKKKKKKGKIFDVPDHIFKRLSPGKMKYERWAKYLSTFEEYERQIFEYIKSNRNHEVVLRNQVTGESKLVTIRTKEELDD